MSAKRPATRPVVKAGRAEPAASAPVTAAVPGPVPQTLRAAQLAVGVQAAALVCGASALVIATFVSTTHRVWIPLSLAGLMVLLAVVLVVCGRGLVNDRISARTPIVLTQLLSLPVGYSLGFQGGYPGFGIPILIVALVVLALVFSPSARSRLE